MKCQLLTIKGKVIKYTIDKYSMFKSQAICLKKIFLLMWTIYFRSDWAFAILGVYILSDWLIIGNYVVDIFLTYMLKDNNITILWGGV